MLNKSKNLCKKTLLFQNKYIPSISKPTRIFITDASIIDHLNMNSFLETDVKTGIIKSDISDHFQYF